MLSILSRSISGFVAFGSTSAYPTTNSFTTNKESIAIRGVVRNQLPRGHLGFFHLHRHVFHGLPHTPRHSILLQTRQNRMLRHASAPKQHDLHQINAQIHRQTCCFSQSMPITVLSIPTSHTLHRIPSKSLHVPSVDDLHRPIREVAVHVLSTRRRNMTEFVRGGSCDRKSGLLRIVLDYPTTRSNSRASGWLGQRNPTLPVPAETRLQKKWTSTFFG